MDRRTTFSACRHLANYHFKSLQLKRALMRLARPLDSHSLTPPLLTCVCLFAAVRMLSVVCVLYPCAHGFLDFLDNLDVTAWPPDFNWALPQRSLCAALCRVRINTAERKKNKHTVPVQPQSPSAQVADVGCRCLPRFISVLDYLWHSRMWSIRFDFWGPRKTAYPPPCLPPTHRRGRLWL